MYMNIVLVIRLEIESQMLQQQYYMLYCMGVHFTIGDFPLSICEVSLLEKSLVTFTESDSLDILTYSAKIYTRTLTFNFHHVW